MPPLSHLVFLTIMGLSCAQDSPPPKTFRTINFTFTPAEVFEVFTDKIKSIDINFTCIDCEDGDMFTIQPWSENYKVVAILNFSLSRMSKESSWFGSGQVFFKGIFLGKTHLSFNVIDETLRVERFTIRAVHPLNCLRKMRILDFAFLAVVAILVGCNTVAYACTLDLAVVKAHLRKPIGISIGFVCQYVFMPLTAFALGRAFNLSDSMSFGLLCYGSSPGGGASNMWTILLRGDLNLSVSMTFISLVSSIAMTSLWIFTLGRQFTKDIVLPYENIFISLASLLGTILIGLAIRRFAPKVAQNLAKIIKPMAAVIIVYILTVGTYTNLFIFKLMNSWQVTLSSVFVSYVGYILACAACIIFRQSWKVSRTIMIETGIQNGALAILICRYSLPQPDGDLATVAPVTALMTCGVPLCIALVVQCIYRKCQGKPMFSSSKEEKEEEEKGREKESNEAAANPAYSGTESPPMDLSVLSAGSLSTSCPSLAVTDMMHNKTGWSSDHINGLTPSVNPSKGKSLTDLSMLSVTSFYARRTSVEFESVV